MELHRPHGRDRREAAPKMKLLTASATWNWSSSSAFPAGMLATSPQLVLAGRTRDRRHGRCRLSQSGRRIVHPGQARPTPRPCRGSRSAAQPRPRGCGDRSSAPKAGRSSSRGPLARAATTRRRPAHRLARRRHGRGSRALGLTTSLEIVTLARQDRHQRKAYRSPQN